MRLGLGVAGIVLAAVMTMDASPASAQSASAQTGATLVAIVTAEPTAPLARRVRAELETLGVDVIVLKPPAESDSTRAPLEQAARGVGAAAAIRLVASSEGKVEVWVADRVTGKAVVRELDASGTNASDAAVAVGTVELLRASLMELHAPEPPRGEVAPTPLLTDLAEPPPELPRLGLATGAGVELGLGGLGPSADARLGLWVRLTTHVGMRLIGQTTLAPAHTASPSGEVDVRTTWFGGSAVYGFTAPTSTWVPEASLGVSAAHVSTTGTASRPYVGTTAETWTTAPFLGVGLGWTLLRGIRLRADAMAMWAVPPVRVRTPGEEPDRWGAPAVIVAPSIELLWSP